MNIPQSGATNPYAGDGLGKDDMSQKERVRWVYHKDRNSGKRNKKGDMVYKRIKIGYIVKEVAVIEKDTPMNSVQKADYRKVIQLIRSTDARLKPLQIRVGYYLRDAGTKQHWRWGSQTAAQMPLMTFRKLVKKAEKEGILEGRFASKTSVEAQ